MRWPTPSRAAISTISKDELGDLLLQVVFHARMAEEEGRFAFGDVVEAITTKMIRRHPHVFADAEGRTAEHVKGMWERIKAEEKAEAKAERGVEPAEGALAGVPAALPALTRALKLQNKAGRVGFDWNDPRAVLAKIREEADEIEAEIEAGDEAESAAPRSAICCSRWSTSPAISTPIRKACCAPPTSNSSGASRRSSGRWPRAARRRRSRRSPKWTRCGTRPRRRRKRGKGR